ncbi:unnamed protein product [Calypogeia fissa]
MPARKCTHYRNDDQCGRSGIVAARFSKLGRKYRSKDDDRGRLKRSRLEFVTKANGETKDNQNVEKNACYDTILVLAGGQLVRGGVPVWVERRLDKALDLQQRSNGNNTDGKICKIVCLGGGTPHRAPILSSDGFVVHESTSCAEYLHRKGVPFAHMIKEWASYDTIGNGYFSLTQHVIPRRWRTMAVVTSEFHMPRTRAVFEWIFGLQGAGVALQQQGPELQRGIVDGVVAEAGMGSKAQGFCLEFHSVPDHGDFDEYIAQARLERERNSIKNLNMLSQRIQSLEDFHEWFHTEHKAYNTEAQALFGKEDKDDPALQSY